MKLPQFSGDIPISKIPNWDKNCLLYRTCPVCENNDYETVCIRPDDLLVAKCKICKMIYLPKIPSEEDMTIFYNQFSSFYGITPSKKSLLGKLLYKNPHILILERSGGLKGKKLLEVGSSYGNFLFEAKKAGAEVYAVELDEKAIAYLKQNNIKCFTEIPENINFDIVCAFHLIEHLNSPKEFIKNVAKILNFKGRLLISTPNAGEVEKVGPSWIGFRLSLEHFNYFSVSTLSKLLVEKDLYTEFFWEYNQPPVWEIVNEKGLKRFFDIPRHILMRLMPVPFPTRGTFHLTVLARKY